MLKNFILVSLAMLAVSGTALASERAGDPVVAEITALKPPLFDGSKRGDAAYTKEFQEARKAYLQKRGDLILKLYQLDPEHPKTVEYLENRWRSISAPNAKEYLEKLKQDVSVVVTSSAPLAVKEAADAAIAEIEVNTALGGSKDPLPIIDTFSKKYPASKRPVRMLTTAGYSANGEAKRSILKKIIALDPEGRSGQFAKGGLRQLDGIGKPFDLAFKDAVNGSDVTVTSLKGKVIIVDFWATWCGPCIAKLPELEAIYNEFKPKGLEVIGVSLDQPEAKGGLTKLKEFVAERKLGWPQYYQGNYWDSEFSASWGINAIPAVFILDKQGNLRAINPSDLKATVAKLLAE